MAIRVELIPGIKSKVVRELDKVKLYSLGEEIASDARRYCPVDTGELRDSIAHGVDNKGTISVWASAPHAIFVELGTSRMGPQPFLRTAVEQNRGV